MQAQVYKIHSDFYYVKNLSNEEFVCKVKDVLKKQKIEIKVGDKVAIVSLSSGILGEPFIKHELDLGIKRLEEFGLIPVFMENSLKGIDFIKNHPEKRAEDLKQAFADNEIKAIICAIGGEDAYLTLPHLLNDEEFKKILNEYIIPNEGGYNNDPDDAGGETNMGISKTTHKNEDIFNMTRERANAIYYRDYYKWNGLNKLPYPIRGFVVDYGLPTNPQHAIETVHKVLDIPPPSNIIGPTTLGKFENYTEEYYNRFLEKYRDEMKKYFQNVVQKNPQKQKYLKGWLNRADRAHLAK